MNDQRFGVAWSFALVCSVSRMSGGDAMPQAIFCAGLGHVICAGSAE